MPHYLHDFVESATRKACDELIEALQALPADKRGWQPGPKARTALDQVAECALINGYTETVIQTRKWAVNDYDAYTQEKIDLAAGSEEDLTALLRQNMTRAISAIRMVPEDALTEDVILPWGTETLGNIILFPYWNMSYHAGQIYYIGSLLPESD